MRNFLLFTVKKKITDFCAELKTFYPSWEIVDENKATDIKIKGGVLSGQT